MTDAPSDILLAQAADALGVKVTAVTAEQRSDLYGPYWLFTAPDGTGIEYRVPQHWAPARSC